jgi:phospholipid/cholesterol/gamma-HCH transport system substrate-binding protein
MNKKTAINIRLGIFVTIGCFLFVGVIYFISAKQQLFNKTFQVSGVFSDVSGLQAGNNVRFSGITVGIIENIKIESDTTVRVTLLIQEDVRRFIKKDAEATIGSEGLMGNKICIISPGTSGQPPIENNDVIRTKPPLNLDQAMATLKTTGDNVSQITGDLADIVHTIRQGKGTLGQLFMDSTYLSQAKANLTQMTGDVAVISGTLRSGKSSLGKLLMDSTYLKEPIDNAIRITSDLSDIIGSVHAGKGVMGRLLMDSSSALMMDTTLTNVKQSTRNMERVTEKAKKSFLLWGF